MGHSKDPTHRIYLEIMPETYAEYVRIQDFVQDMSDYSHNEGAFAIGTEKSSIESVSSDEMKELEILVNAKRLNKMGD